MTVCSVMSRHSNVETFAQLRAAHQSGSYCSVFSPLEVCWLQSEKHLFQLFIAGGYAVNHVSCIQRSVTMHWMKQLGDRRHIRLEDTYRLNMARGVVNCTKSPLLLCTLHPAESLGDLVPFWLPHIHSAGSDKYNFVALIHLWSWFKWFYSGGRGPQSKALILGKYT